MFVSFGALKHKHTGGEGTEKEGETFGPKYDI